MKLSEYLKQVFLETYGDMGDDEEQAFETWWSELDPESLDLRVEDWKKRLTMKDTTISDTAHSYQLGYIKGLKETQSKLIIRVDKMRDEYVQNSIKNGFAPSGASLNIFSDVLALLKREKENND